MKWVDHDILMVPGPSEPYQEVLAELSKPVLPHYGREWKQVYEDTCSNLKRIFNTKDDVIILPGCGNAGLELAVANLVEPGDKVIVVYDGYFADYFKELVEVYEGLPILVSAPHGTAVKPQEIRDTLEGEADVKAIITAHNETLAGVKHDLAGIGKIAKEFNLYNIVDAVSSFGGMEIDMDGWSIDICIGYASKSLGSINGVTPVAINSRVWDYIKKRESSVRSRFLNLKLWRKTMDEWASWGHPFPISQPTSVIVALKKATEIALEEGLENRYKRHKISKKAVRQGVKALGLEPFVVRDDDASETVTSIKLPDEVASAKITSSMKEHFNIVVGSMNLIGVNGLRIAHMASTASPHYILPTMLALEVALRKSGWKVKEGESVRETAKAFSDNL
jgi:aspartate aminotransferase-like enzyme